MATTKKRDTAALKSAFLEAYASTGSYRAAASEAGVSPRSISRWRLDDPDFAEGIVEVRGVLVETLASSLYQRALVDDTTAGIYLLKCWEPSVYNRAPQPTARPEVEERGEIRVEIIAPDGGRQALMDKLSQQSRRMEGTGAEAGY